MTGDRARRIRKFVTLRIKQPVVRLPAGERRPSHVDDPRLRKDRMNQADMLPVGRVLVDEMTSAFRTMQSALIEIARAKRPSPLGGQCDDRFRIAPSRFRK